MIEHIGGVHGHCLAHDCCGHQHDCCHNDHEHFLVNDALSNVDDLYDTLMTHISRKTIHTPKDEIIKLINDSIDEALSSINDRDYLTVEEVRLEFNKLIKQLSFLKEIPEEYITEQELNEILDRRIGTIDNAKYCTLAQVQGLLGSYAKKSDLPDLSAYALKSDIFNFTYGLSISGSTVSIIKNGGSSSITIPTGNGSGNDSSYILPVATSTALGGIKIGYPASGKNYAVLLDSNNRAFVNVPWTGGTSDGPSSGDSVIITPLLNTGTKIASYSINGETTKYLYAPTSTPDGPSSGESHRYYNVSVYKAVSKDIQSLNKPSSIYTFNYDTNTFTAYPEGWYATPATAIENYNDLKCQVWISHNNLCDDGTSTGWTTPVKYYNVDEIIKDAKDEANQYYQQQLTNAESELNSVIKDANDKLAQALSLLDQFADGDISGIALKVSELEGSIKTHGWNIDEDTSTVTYAEDLFDMVNKKLVKLISESDVDNQTVKSAMETMMAGFIKLNVYDYTKHGPIDETYINMTPTQIVLSALGGTSSDNETVDKESIQSALIDIVKDKITLSITRGSDGAGTSFTLGFDGNGDSKAVLDADNFVVTGEMISNAVNTNGLTIAEGVANINKEGEAFFGNGTSQFKKDGSGYIAGGNIQWNKNGDVTVNANGTFNGTVNANNGTFNGIVNATSFLVVNSTNKPTMELTTIGTTNLKITNPTALKNAGLEGAPDDTPIIIVTLYEVNGNIKDQWIVKFEKITGTVLNLVSNYFTNAVKVTEKGDIPTNIINIYKYYDGTLGDSPTIKQTIDGLYALKYFTQHAIKMDNNRYCICNTNTYVTFEISNGIATFVGSFYTGPRVTCTYDSYNNPIIDTINRTDVYVYSSVEHDTTSASRLYYENGEYINNGSSIIGGICYLCPYNSTDRTVPYDNEMDGSGMLYNFDEESNTFTSQNVSNVL